jgi:hypothetical protein
MADFIYKTLWPFTQNKETKRYRWRFEEPDAGHKVLEELFCDYEGSQVIVLKCQSSKNDYHAILGKYDKDNDQVVKFMGAPEFRKKTMQKIANILKISGVMDI